METQLLTVKDITTATQFPWTVKIVVLEKLPIRESIPNPLKQRSTPHRPLPSPSRYQRLVIADREGTRVQLTIFGKDIIIFEDNLVVGNAYYISNCKVSYIEPKHRLVPHDYQWTLGASSLIKVVNESDQMIVPLLNNFVSFRDLHPFKDSFTKTVDIVAIALHLLPIKERTTKTGAARLQELIIINKEMQPMMLTMWNDFLDNEAISIAKVLVRKPVILARRMRVVSYNGLSLSTKIQSSIMIDPDVPEANEMQVWLSTNFSAVHAFTLTKTFQAFTETSTSSSTEEIILFSELPTLPDNRSYPAECTLEIVDFKQPFYYMSCFKCYKATSAAFMEVFTCNHCKCADAHAVPRCCVHVNATDSSETIIATLFGADAENFVRTKAITIMQNLDHNGVDHMSSILNCKSDGAIKVTVKPYHHDFRGETIRKFNISISDSDYALSPNEASSSKPLASRRKLILEDIEQVTTQPEILRSRHAKNIVQEIQMPSTITVADLPKLPENKNYPVQCTLEIVDFTQKFWYMSCFICFEATSATFQQVFECKNCKRDDTYAVPRCSVRVSVIDESGIITANLFGKDAESFVGCKAQTLMENLAEKTVGEICSVIKCKSYGTVKVMIKPYNYRLQGKTVRKYDISLINSNLSSVSSQIPVPSSEIYQEATQPSQSNKGKTQEQHLFPKALSSCTSSIIHTIDTPVPTAEQPQTAEQPRTPSQ